MLQTKNKDYTVVLHDGPLPPRFFKINKKLLKFTILLIVLITFLSILLSLIYTTYIQNKVERSKNAVPVEIQRLSSKLKNTQKLLLSEKKLVKNLQYKIANPSADNTVVNSLIPLPVGFKDLRSLKMASVENIVVNNEEKSSILKFDIYNNTKEDIRLSGYIYVFRMTEGLIESYPEQKLDGYKLTDGESFTITKFRPTRIELKKTQLESLYKIFVFSRTGDLLDYKEYKK